MSCSFEKLEKTIISCRRCPRLVEFREHVPSVPTYKDEVHWRKPVPGFGDRQARLLIVGLAPAIVGGNRTGRIFTGDLTAKFLMNALFQLGFANQNTSTHMNDGLILKDCYLTAVVKCVPPHHKPIASEFRNCRPYLAEELNLLKNVKCVLALGRDAFQSYLQGQKYPFVHGNRIDIKPTLYCSYHPSPRNVNTGLLTEKMFLNLLKRIKDEL